MRFLLCLAISGAVAAHGGCLSPPDPVREQVSALDSAGDLTTPAVMAAVFGDAFGLAGVAITPAKSGSTAAIAALAAGSQSFAALLQGVPTGYRDRIVARTEGIFAARAGTSLGSASITTADAQQYLCPISGTFASTIGGASPSMVVQDTQPDTADSVLADLCGTRTLRSGTILVQDGPIARQWTGTSFVSVAVTGPGKFCASGDSGPACVAKSGAQSGILGYADSRVQLNSGIALLQLDGITPLAAGYPRIRDIHLVDASDTDARVTSWWQWLDGDATHPDHHSAFESAVSARGLIPVASF